MRIQVRIFIGFLAVLAIGITSIVYWISDDLKPQFRKATEDPLVDASRVLASFAGTTARDGKVDVEMFRDAFEDAYSRPLNAEIYGYVKSGVEYRVYITDPDGTVVFDSDGGRDEGKDYSSWNDVYLTMQGEYGARTTRKDPDDPSTSTMYIASPVVADGKVIGVLSVGKPSVSTNRFAEDAKRKFMIAGLVIGASAVAVGMLLSWRITEPIKRLTRYARSVRDGEKAEMPELGGGETRELGEAFEEMRSALDGKEYVEKYIQTLTHEIKSPISAIRGATELLAEDMPPEQRERFLANIREETERIGAVVERLLLLSSLEKLTHLEETRPIDMFRLVSDIREGLFPILEARKLKLTVSGSRDCVVEGDPFLIRQAVLNLVQNAVDFSPEGSEINAELESSDNGVILSVRDRGAGMPEYAACRVFERFYSLKRPDTGKKSTGLGLCLVQEVVNLHRGSVTLANTPEGGLVATLALPAKVR